MPKIRIAVMADAFDRRPENTLFFRHIIEALIDNPGYEVTLVHFKPMPDEPLYTKAREVLIRPMPIYAGHFFAYLKYCLTTKDRFDVVHQFTGRLYPFFWLFPARKRVIMAHDGGERLAPGKWTLERFTFVAMLILFQKHIDAVIGVSEYATKQIMHAFFMPPEKVVTIYPHLDPTYATVPSRELIDATLPQYGLTYKGYFVYIGRFRTHKNVGNTVEAYLRYREQNPEATELLALGGGTKEEFERIFGKLRKSPYANDISFLGHIPNDHMPILYAGSVALAFATLNEGFGVPIIEGMACETPVITSTVTAMPEIAGDAALLVDPSDPDALTEAFQLIHSDPALAAELVKRGKVRCRDFTWDKVLERTFGLFERVVAKNAKVVNPVRGTL